MTWSQKLPGLSPSLSPASDGKAYLSGKLVLPAAVLDKLVLSKAFPRPGNYLGICEMPVGCSVIVAIKYGVPNSQCSGYFGPVHA